MQFECTVTINQPIDRVIEIFDCVENLKHWQDGFQSFEHLSGSPGEAGAKSKMVYQSGKHRIELVETLQVKNLPSEMVGHYEAKQMVNLMTNRFEALGDSQTKWTAQVEYLEFRGLMPKLMAKLFPGVFKKQVQKWLDQFKAFTESEG